jgi:tRNA G18 (ribose-2'-O)-methylase SpoU
MTNFVRESTRRQRYNKKKSGVQNLPLSFATINFAMEENIAFVTRAAACFGARNIFVIGTIPKYAPLKSRSGSTNHLVNFLQFSNPSEFVAYAKQENLKLVSIELCDGAVSLFDYKFSKQENTCLIVGHETSGVPAEILMHSEKVFIPMNGAGFCLNTSQAANIAAYEYAKQSFAN